MLFERNYTICDDVVLNVIFTRFSQNVGFTLLDLDWTEVEFENPRLKSERKTI